MPNRILCIVLLFATAATLAAQRVDTGDAERPQVTVQTLELGRDASSGEVAVRVLGEKRWRWVQVRLEPPSTKPIVGPEMCIKGDCTFRFDPKEAPSANLEIADVNSSDLIKGSPKNPSWITVRLEFLPPADETLTTAIPVSPAPNGPKQRPPTQTENAATGTIPATPIDWQQAAFGAALLLSLGALAFATVLYLRQRRDAQFAALEIADLKTQLASPALLSDLVRQNHWKEHLEAFQTLKGQHEILSGDVSRLHQELYGLRESQKLAQSAAAGSATGSSVMSSRATVSVPPKPPPEPTGIFRTALDLAAALQSLGKIHEKAGADALALAAEIDTVAKQNLRLKKEDELVARWPNLATRAAEEALLLADTTLDQDRRTETIQSLVRTIAGIAQVQVIAPQNGDEFLPQHHKPVRHVPTPDHATPLTVARVDLRGYIFQGTVVRKAEVALYQ